MIKLNDDMKMMIKQQLGYVSTVSKAGLPNIGPKRSARLYNDSQLIWNENTGGQTLKNVMDGSKVAIAFVNWGRNLGYRFVCSAKAYREGKEYDDACEFAKASGINPPKMAVVLSVEEVYTLASGPLAGKKVKFD